MRFHQVRQSWGVVELSHFNLPHLSGHVNLCADSVHLNYFYISQRIKFIWSSDSTRHISHLLYLLWLKSMTWVRYAYLYWNLTLSTNKLTMTKSNWKTSPEMWLLLDLLFKPSFFFFLCSIYIFFFFSVGGVLQNKGGLEFLTRYVLV